MCRHLAYLGPPVTLSSLVLEPEHSLYEQSWAPTDMRGGGSINADGFGLGWYPEGDAAVSGGPVRYRRDVPIWTDENLPGLARTIRSGAVLAAIRNGTVGLPYGQLAVAPFAADRWLFSHNGRIPGWPQATAKLAERLPAADLLTAAPIDSAFLWALVAQRLGEGVPPADAVAEVVQDVETLAPGSRLNLLLTDGEQLVATAWVHSLHVRRTEKSVTVASEPFGPGTWTAVPDRSLLVATATTVQITRMEGRE